MGKAGVTRAGTTGAISATTSADFKKAEYVLDEKGGFGVFAYYVDNGSYADGTSTPNFMYNQHVDGTPDAKDGSNAENAKGIVSWSYSPIKYWPNESSTTLGISAGVDKLTFFAYAPFVDNVPNTGEISTPGESGILAFVENDDETAYKNTSIGDPRIKFTIDPDPTKCVDLLWAVVPSTEQWTGSGATTAVNDNEVYDNASLTAGLPWLNVTKQTTNGSVKFLFKHALAKMKFMVDADVNDVRDGASDHTNAVDANTKIFVREVYLQGKIAQTGYLNLNNTAADTPLWEKLDGSAFTAGSETDQNFTFKDGRTDGKEGNEDANPATSESGNSSTETVVGLNDVLIQTATTGTGTYTLSSNAGVTNTAVPLLTNGGEFYVIPTASDAQTFTIRIVYDVLTKDDNLAGYLADGKIHGSNVENNITKTASFAILAGKAYTIYLHLGMTDVTLDAKVADWTDVGAQEVDLPINAVTP